MEGIRAKAQFGLFLAAMGPACMQPWYAKMGSQLLPVAGQQQAPSAMAGITYATNSIAGTETRKHRGDHKDSKKQRKKDKKERKEARRLQPKASRVSKADKIQKSDKSQKAAVLHALRREREAREAAERDKARMAVLQATKQIDGCGCCPRSSVFHLSRNSSFFIDKTMSKILSCC